MTLAPEQIKWADGHVGTETTATGAVAGYRVDDDGKVFFQLEWEATPPLTADQIAARESAQAAEAAAAEKARDEAATAAQADADAAAAAKQEKTEQVIKALGLDDGPADALRELLA